MRSRPILAFVLASVIPSSSWAASKEMVELQRDVSDLQSQIKNLQKTLDEKMIVIQTLLQQTVDNSAKSNTSIAVVESTIRDRMTEQQRTMVAPIANVGAKVDQMSSDFNGMRESVSDMSERMTKLQAQMTELSNTVRTLNAPPAPPPGGPVGGSTTPPIGMSPKQVYESAMRDRSGGNLDLATQGFEEYLRYYANTDLAPSAQFYLGQIAYDKGDFPGAVRNFDTVLEKYPDNPKSPDASFMKGMALLKSNQRDAAAKEFLSVVTKYPNAEVAAKARAQRKALGLTSPSAAAPPARRRR